MKKKETDQKVETKLNELMEQIQKMPRGNERWEFFRTNKDYNEICEEILETLNKKFLKQVKENNTDLIAKVGVKHTEQLDGLVFVEVLKELICEYEQSEVGFYQKFRQKYKQHYNKERNKVQLQEQTGGMHWDNEDRFIRLCFECQKLQEKMGKTFSFEQFRGNMNLGLKHYPEKLKKEAYEKVMQIRRSGILQDGEGEEYDPLDFVTYGTENEACQNPEDIILNQEENEDLWQSIRLYRMVSNILKVKEKQIIRAIVTRNVLKELKLEQGSAKHFKEESGCPGYHRYQSYPAGDEDVYDLLRQKERLFMDEIFVDPYLALAIEEEPESIEELYGVYYNFLQESFKFTDQKIAEALGEDKRKISRYKKKYKQLSEQI